MLNSAPVLLDFWPSDVCSGNIICVLPETTRAVSSVGFPQLPRGYQVSLFAVDTIFNHRLFVIIVAFLCSLLCLKISQLLLLYHWCLCVPVPHLSLQLLWWSPLWGTNSSMMCFWHSCWFQRTLEVLLALPLCHSCYLRARCLFRHVLTMPGILQR